VLEIKRLLYEKRYTIEGARRFLETRERPQPARSGAKRAPKAEQRDLFATSSPVIEKIRKELREIADMLK